MATREFNQQIILRPRNRLDFQEGTLLQQQLAAILPERYNFWIIDMSNVEFIDSSGLCALVRGLKLARQKGCRLVICNLSPTVKLIFEITQLDPAFEVFDSFDAIFSKSSNLLIA